MLDLIKSTGPYMPKIDLHVHSLYSPDGGVTPEQVERKLKSGQLDYIAITDHNTIQGATIIQQKLGELGSRIIVGSEIMTTQGEIIGLYLTDEIAPHQTPEQTISAIKEQGGVVYIPHPFETGRSGLPLKTIEDLVGELVIDPYNVIFETFNGRAYIRSKAKQAMQCAQDYGFPTAHSSDAHGYYGWGNTFTEITAAPTPNNLVELLHHGTGSKRRVKPLATLYPALNKSRKRARKRFLP